MVYGVWEAQAQLTTQRERQAANTAAGQRSMVENHTAAQGRRQEEARMQQQPRRDAAPPWVRKNETSQAGCHPRVLAHGLRMAHAYVHTHTQQHAARLASCDNSLY